MMKLLKKSVPAWAVIIAIIATGALVFAAVKVTYDITSTVTVEAVYGITVLDYETKTIEISSFAFGTIAEGETISTYKLNGWGVCVKNTGNEEFYLGWNVTDLPAGFELICIDSMTGYDPIPQNNFSLYGPIQPGDYAMGTTDVAQFDFRLTNVGALPDDYTFTIKFLGADTPTG